MTPEPLRGFFAYPSKPPTLAETIRNAIQAINTQVASLSISSWEDSRVAGKVIINEICKQIASSNLFLADVTGINPNVMFELGYAIARNKRIWVVLDRTLPVAKRDYERIHLLTGVGYVGYSNSTNIMTAFLEDHPYTDSSDTIYAKTIEPTLLPSNPSHLLYLRLHHDTEAERHVSELVSQFQRMGLPAIIDDPNETRIQPLSWYGQKTYAAVATLAHFSSPRREGWEVHNARYAFVCGLAHGFGVPILMLAEADYAVPLDYQHLLARYTTARECADHATRFLEEARQSYLNRQAPPLELRQPVMAVELKALRLGEHIAENEIDQLDDYFVETAAFNEALRGRFMVFVGRKGSGKTANLIRLGSALRSDPRNLVVLVKPVGYDLDGVLRLLRKYREKDTKGYLVESLWKFLLYSEIAHSAAEAVEARPPQTWNHDQIDLIELMDEQSSLLRESFAVRLEKCVESVLPLRETGKVETTRTAISEALHTGLLRQLRAILGRVLHDRLRVAVLVDNLDKSWTRNGDMDELSGLFLGLIGAARRLPTEFFKGTHGREPVNLTLTIFVRSDIFSAVLRRAREPDKIAYSRIVWEDPLLLLRVLEQRFVASHNGKTSPGEMWRAYFCPMVRGKPTRDYIAGRTLPRPRDAIFLGNTAISVAINRDHTMVEEGDLLDAETQYSQFAFEGLVVEGSSTQPKIEEILYEFAGANSIVREDEVLQHIGKIVKDRSQARAVMNDLIWLSFLGPEIQAGTFEFATDEEDMQKISVLARKLRESRGLSPRYKVNPALSRYLEIRES